MGTKRWKAALLALWLGANVASVSMAKPPDLPARNEVDCQDAGPGRIRLEREASGLVRVEVEPAPADGADDRPICLDAWCPQMLPVLVQRICEHILAILPSAPATAQATSVAPAAPAPDTVTDDAAGNDAARSRVDPVFAATAEKAHSLYRLASRCARQGKLAEARAHLREAHLANPTCRWGRRAIQRLQEMEALPPGEEMSEPSGPQAPQPMTQTPGAENDAAQAERGFRRLRETTQPLGLVLPPTY